MTNQNSGWGDQSGPDESGSSSYSPGSEDQGQGSFGSPAPEVPADGAYGQPPAYGPGSSYQPEQPDPQQGYDQGQPPAQSSEYGYGQPPAGSDPAGYGYGEPPQPGYGQPEQPAPGYGYGQDQVPPGYGYGQPEQGHYGGGQYGYSADPSQGSGGFQRADGGFESSQPAGSYGASLGGSGQDQYGQDQYGQNQYGQDQYVQNQYGQDQYGQSPQNPYGQNQYGSGTDAGSSAYGQPADAGYQPADPGYAVNQPGYGQSGSTDYASAAGSYGQGGYGDQQYGQGGYPSPGAYGQQGGYGQQAYGQPAYGQQPGYPASTAGAFGQPYAPWSKRALGWLVDYGPYLLALLLGAGINGATGTGWPFWIFALAGNGWIIYSRWVKGGSTGVSMGRQIAHTKLISATTGQPIGAGMTIVRDIAHIVDSIICGIGWLFPLWDEKRQTVADKIVSTVVVETPADGAPPQQLSGGQPQNVPPSQPGGWSQ